MRMLVRTALPCLLLLAACGGGDDGAGPGDNQPPYFSRAPAAVLPGALLVNVVTGDQIGFEALAVDPDVEPVSYLWELVDQGGTPITDGSAGTVVNAQSAIASWSVSEFEGVVRMRCTISDGKSSTFAFTRSYSCGTPLVNQTITSDLTLDAAGSPYVVMGGITVASQATLQIAAGVELQMRLTRNASKWDRERIQVLGTLRTLGVQSDPVVVRGGYTEDPEAGGGIQQFAGIVVQDAGVAELEYTRVEVAEVGLQIVSSEPSTARFCNFTRCGTGVRVERGEGTQLTSVLLRDNSIGLQLNSAGVRVEDSFFRDSGSVGIFVDASTGVSSLEVFGSEFQGNLSGHVRMSSVSNPISATIKGTNFLQQSTTVPAINLDAACFVYTLDLRGNYWGASLIPSQIVKLFANDKSCGADVLSWTDSDCGGDPDACDWSNSAW